MPQGQIPSDTVTLLFTDVEGSTKLWEAHPEAMRIALARHDTLLREAVAGPAELWPEGAAIRVRMGLHTGAVELRAVGRATPKRTKGPARRCEARTLCSSGVDASPI